MDFKKSATIDKTLKNYNRALDENESMKKKQKERQEQLARIRMEKRSRTGSKMGSVDRGKT